MRTLAVFSTGILLAALGACGPSSPGSSASDAAELPPGPISCPSQGDLNTAAGLVPGLLPDEARLKAWEEHMVGLGPRFTGSPALKSWHNFMAAQFASYGLGVQRETIPIAWWHHKKWSLHLIQDGVETEVPVASYFPYSGYTPEGGITATVVNAGIGDPAQMAAANPSGKIVFYEENMLPATAAIFYATLSYLHDPDNTLTPATPYKRAATSFLTPQEETSLVSAEQLGAVGAIVSYEASAENAAGQYTPFLTEPGKSQHVPALYVDRATGDAIKAKIAQGAQARLELVVDPFPEDSTDDILATLPGMTDEVMVINSHTDGTSASEENGVLGVMSLAKYFAALPKSCRQRTMLFVLTPGHFNSSIGDTQHFIDKHPEIIAKTVASETIEHLGQLEWLDDASGFHASGLTEAGAFFGSTDAVQLIMKNAVIAEDLRRTFVLRPYGVIYFGVGSPLNAAGVPNAAYITGPNQMLSFAHNQHIDKIDYARMAAEIRTATRVAATMDGTATDVLCAGTGTQSPQKPTGCTPAP